VRLLLDEQINPAVAAQLRARGHDVVAVHEAGTRGASDEEQLAAATAQRRALVTYNIADFHALLVEWAHTGRIHWGIVFVSERSVPQRSAGALVQALDRFLRDFLAEDAMVNQAVYLARGGP
jgi:predicted nuclease of predicted toxin-antitoxin system